jgi:hypothetical protein
MIATTGVVRKNNNSDAIPPAIPTQSFLWLKPKIKRGNGVKYANNVVAKNPVAATKSNAELKIAVPPARSRFFLIKHCLLSLTFFSGKRSG